jgi:hypothetical protein
MDVIPAAPPAPARTRRCSADAPALLLLGSAAAVEPSSSSRVGAALAPAGCSGPKTRSSRFCCLRVCSCSGAEQAHAPDGFERGANSDSEREGRSWGAPPRRLSHRPAQLTKTPRSTDRRDGVCLTAGTKSASLTADACLTVKSGRASRVAAKPPPVYAADTVPRAAAAAAPAAHRTAEITSAGASPSPQPTRHSGRPHPPCCGGRGRRARRHRAPGAATA